MTIAYPAVLAAIRADSGRQMLACFAGLTPNEVVELATFIGDKRLAAIRRLSIGATDAAQLAVRTPPVCRTREASLVELIAETSFQAFGDAVSCFDRGRTPGEVAHLVTAGLADVARRRRASQFVTIDEDPTGTLPATPHRVPRALNDDDFRASATRNAVDVAAIKAASAVESSGAGFDAEGRPKVNYEGHYFRRLTRRKFDRTHPHLSHPYYAPANNPYRNWNQLERLLEAILLREDEALMSASWGRFQVMGEFHSGWPNVRDFVAAMYVSEENHLKSFEAHVGPAGMAELRRKDWLAFARRYNGPDQVGYDGRLDRAYRANGGR